MDHFETLHESLNRKQIIILATPKICPKCLGSGLQTAVAGVPGILPAVHYAKCFLCDGKGWLPDDSTATWIPDYE